MPDSASSVPITGSQPLNQFYPAGITNQPGVLVLVLIFAALVRGVALFGQYQFLDADPDGYRQLAVGLAEQGVLGTDGVPSAYRPPLYPLLLVPITHLTSFSLGVAVLHWCCGVATVFGCYWLAERWVGARFAWVAALWIACDPILLRQSALVMTETVATLLAVLSLMALTEFGQWPRVWRALIAGGCLGLATLCRPTFLPWCALAPLTWWLLPEARQTANAAIQAISSRRRAMYAVFMFAAAVAVLLPWVIRNQQVMGRPIVTTTHGGYTLYLGNNPEFYQHLNERLPGGSWTANLFDQRIAQQRLAERGGQPATPADELRADQREYQAALESIRLQPFGFTDACQFRLLSLWGLRPHQGGSVALLIGIWYAVEFAFAIVGLFHLRWRLLRTPWSWGLLLVLVFTAAHAIYWSNFRMRAPLMPVVSLAATAGFTAAWTFSARRKISV